MSLEQLSSQISNCTLCADYLPLSPRPVFQVGSASKILVVGQAPGTKVHASGIPWDDASGRNLRKWLGVSEEQFYDPKLFAIIPMGFCYPGKGKSGDLPPRPECAPKWHAQLLAQMPKVELTLLIGKYAQVYYLESPQRNLTETVRSFEKYLPDTFPLVHPSPRNAIWMKKNSWFEEEVIPVLQSKTHAILHAQS